jgi:hypothetical protein
MAMSSSMQLDGSFSLSQSAAKPFSKSELERMQEEKRKQILQRLQSKHP